MSRVLAHLRWWARQLSGDDRYAAYVTRCELSGTPAMPRAAWERHRSDHRDSHPQGRCC